MNLLNEWMDPRHIVASAFDNPTDEERERPPMWRFWRALPPKGKIGMLSGSWYTTPIIDRVFKHSKPNDLARAIDEINRFEKMLADDGALILKFWFRLSKKRQKKRLKALASDPETSWKITKRDWDFFKLYDRFYSVSEEALRETSTSWAPWLVVEGSDREYRAVTVGRTLLEAMRMRLAAPPERRAKKRDLSLSLRRGKYQNALREHQRELALLTRHPNFGQHTVVAVLEGMDAAGKGGPIRRITAALDARLYRIIPIAAPTDEARTQPYLWRVWRHVPRMGRYTIFDRSWYGRVLVERIEGFAQEADWMRAYSEISDFEEQLARHGVVVIKYWLQIAKDEQHKRFKQREHTRHKQFKITPEDWRNREKWNAYQFAVADMIERTSTVHAPWVLVESNDKYWARVKILQTLVAALRARLKG